MGLTYTISVSRYPINPDTGADESDSTDIFIYKGRQHILVNVSDDLNNATYHVEGGVMTLKRGGTITTLKELAALLVNAMKDTP